MDAARSYGGHSMVSRLRRVLLCSPQTSGWENPACVNEWKSLAYRHKPDTARAATQHDCLRQELERFGVEILDLTGCGNYSLDGVYAHDPSFVTDQGVICLRMGKACRRAEPARHREFYNSIDVPVLGEIDEPGTAEAGDIVWLDEKTLLVGRGYRTNDSGVNQIRELLEPSGIEVVASHLPYGGGPSSCLHLMSLLSLVDVRTALVDLAWLAVPTVELLEARGFRFIEIEPSERGTLACNVLAVGERRLLAFAENPKTNRRLEEAGFDVKALPGSEIGINGGGGFTCLTRPLLRST